MNLLEPDNMLSRPHHKCRVHFNRRPASEQNHHTQLVLQWCTYLETAFTVFAFKNSSVRITFETTQKTWGCRVLFNTVVRVWRTEYKQKHWGFEFVLECRRQSENKEILQILKVKHDGCTGQENWECRKKMTVNTREEIVNVRVLCTSLLTFSHQEAAKFCFNMLERECKICDTTTMNWHGKELIQIQISVLESLHERCRLCN